MGPVRLLQFVSIALVLFLGAGIAAWVLLRPPAETASAPMLDAVDRVGQIRRVTIELVDAIQQLVALSPAASAEKLTRARMQVELYDVAAGRLLTEFKTTETMWVPVDHAQSILEGGRSLAEQALKMSPTIPVSEKAAAGVDSLESDPDKTGLPQERAQALKRSGELLIESSENLKRGVQQSVDLASFSKGTLFGFSAADVLVGLLILAGLSALVAIRGASSWMTVPPAQAAKNELRRMAVTDPPAAMKACHDRVRELLEMADGFCRGERA